MENNQLQKIRYLCRQLDAIEKIIQQMEGDESHHQLEEYTKAREDTLQLLLSAINEKSGIHTLLKKDDIVMIP